jgi:mannose-6-phosphate isomerase-like protein (cupin superfamily)
MVQNMEVVLKRFDQPDEVRTFEKGKFEIVRIGGMTIGRATYEPGWRWSLHVRPATGMSSCPVEHVGMVVSGRAIAAMENGAIVEMRPGDIFYIAPGHTPTATKVQRQRQAAVVATCVDQAT